MSRNRPAHPCSIDGCTKVGPTSRGMCINHYQRWYRTRPTTTPCVVDGCTKPPVRGVYCIMHGGRVKRHGSPHVTLRPRRERVISHNGYVLLHRPDHPAADRAKKIPEHRLVMEHVLGRYLLPGENVHHRNGVRDDNRPENLELWVTTQPSGQRPADLVLWAREILARYA